MADKVKKGPDARFKVPRLECRWCGLVCSLPELKRNHGKLAPICVGARTRRWASSVSHRPAGRWTQVVVRAGLAVWRPVAVYEWREELRVVVEGRPPRQFLYTEWFVEYVAFAPEWALDLAIRLENEDVLRHVFPSGELLHHKSNAKPWLSGPEVGSIVHTRLPIEQRATILRSAAANAMVREMLDDDLESALTIIRGQL